ncbi:helix-turn-helix transcriptional regulator [Microbacterium sp. SORGH_AS_0888]|uniref:helix-turn-helix transcriptional regulator n=1 Tax=Microbacterium sp. SORGH_AS_0888 TaxID=3041791 RepID=UPI00277E7A42|nr:helix-turn-helix transcriptional regulator [Microbacterium sp. SORGH_AS_0888]MDQ1129687.1 transcriptional regulator with XRE-family HTH domain [Microbacterium sp. SORGH_AS_0888]
MAHELGDFLRARRTDAALSPESGVARRRIRGLRREEVATAAGISVDYYTRLEQGRETHPSDAVLDALARTLRLAPDAREHLFRLRGTAMSRPAPSPDDTLVERMAALVDAVRPNPAYVLDRLSTMVAVNPEGLALYAGFAALPPGERNTCRYLLTDPRAREVFVEWEELARGAVAQLRAANADDLHDPSLEALVAELGARSPLFAEWWSDHLVERRRASATHIRTAADGTVARRYEVLRIPDEELRMTLWLPPPSSTDGRRCATPSCAGPPSSMSQF